MIFVPRTFSRHCETSRRFFGSSNKYPVGRQIIGIMPCQEDNDEDESFKRNKEDLKSNATHVYVYGTAEFFLQLNTVIECNNCDIDVYILILVRLSARSLLTTHQ